MEPHDGEARLGVKRLDYLGNAGRLYAGGGRDPTAEFDEVTARIALKLRVLPDCERCFAHRSLRVVRIVTSAVR
jgi:hypothetical protein